MTRKLIVFADGTGNAFTTQESNVWRLYCATDRSKSDQVARYIPGVGTSGFKPYAIFDGVTGIGVPSNVRELYRFLCWSWRPGDEIYLFGFSRGAFTIRTLIGLIHHEGLVPSAIDGRRVSRDEMARNCMAAWRSYRAKSHPARYWQLTILLARLGRDAVLAAWHGALRHRGYPAVHAATQSQDRQAVPIRYVGLFDTVEAYGVPIDELRAAIDTVVWPISFRNQKLSPLVQQARHAMALDDERQSFHPVRFDRSEEATGRIEEMWFAGAHSDVGGGYPDGELALVPLGWMIEGAVQAGLRLDGPALTGFAEAASDFGPRHDPRSGLAMFYRYAPRPIASDKASGGEPVVHQSVVARMLDGRDGYAPLTLPSTALAPELDDDTPPSPVAGRDGITANAGLISAVRDVIWWRRVVYWLLFLVTALLVLLPWIGPHLDVLLGRGAVRRLDGGIKANLGSVQRALGGLVPDYAAEWIDAVVANPVAVAVLAAAFAVLYRWNTRLHDRARDLARAAWIAPGAGAHPPVPMGGVARALRRWPGADMLGSLATRVALPLLLALGLVAGVALTWSRTTVTYKDGSGSGTLCEESPPDKIRMPDRGGTPEVEATSLFPAEALCWASGIRVEKGRIYLIRIEEVEPFLDQAIMSGVGGFTIDDWKHWAASPIRRWWSAEWFQPVIRIGAAGGVETPLLSMDRTEVPSAARGSDGLKRLVRATDKADFGAPKPAGAGKLSDAALAEARAIHRQQRLDRVLVARFAAAESGELFFYLNDAIFWTPWGGISGFFYDNNSGRARVRVAVLPLP